MRWFEADRNDQSEARSGTHLLGVHSRVPRVDVPVYEVEVEVEVA